MSSKSNQVSIDEQWAEYVEFWRIVGRHPRHWNYPKNGHVCY